MARLRNVSPAGVQRRLRVVLVQAGDKYFFLGVILEAQQTVEAQQVGQRLLLDADGGRRVECAPKRLLAVAV